MHKKRFYILFFLIGISNLLIGQDSPYPQNYFVYPVDKAQVGIVANFGELRPNHWHMGLDCRTNAQENYPILAAAEGYIAKVKIEPYGFGNALYINHPNGFTTLYAHLNDFFPELQAYVKQQQYAQKKWNVFLDIPKDLFKVTKGMFIAKSGNTGGSMGPHLHFEIRDTKTDKVLNPLRFGFNLPDKVAPTVTSLVLYDRNKSTYEQSPLNIPIIKKGNQYFSKDTFMLNTDCFSLAIGAYDQLSATPNQNGIFAATMYIDDQPITAFRLDSIDYNETRFLNAHIDYKLKYNGGKYLQHLSALPGNTIAAYTTFKSDGSQIEVVDNQSHKVFIEVLDANNNKCTISFYVKKKTTASSLKENTTVPYNAWHPGAYSSTKIENLEIKLAPSSLYDFIVPDVKSIAANSISNKFMVHYPYVPVHNDLEIYITPKLKIDASLQNKIIMLQEIKGKTEGLAASIQKNGAYKSTVRSFGNYSLAVDTTAPVITPNGFSNNGKVSNIVRFKIKDNYTSIKSCNAFIDGTWVLVGFKGENFYYKVDENCPAGKHELKIEATDIVGNTSTKTFTIIK
jgi:hypothetical protein